MTQETTTKIDVNQTQTACLRESTYLTKTVIHNICTGTKTDVPHGSLDMALGVLAVLLIAGLLSVLVRLFWWMD